MIRSFVQMQDEVLKYIRKTDSTEWRTMVKAYLNLSYMEIMEKVFVPQMLETYTFDTVSGTRTYALPADFQGIIGMQMVSKAGDTDWAKNISQINTQRFWEQYPKGVSTDNREPGVFRIKRVDGVATRVTGTDAITAKSSYANDVTPLSVSVVAYQNSTRDTTVHGSAVLTGTSAVAVNKEDGTAMTSYEPFQISKSNYTGGIITVLKGTTVVGTLAPWQISSEFCEMEFNDTPDAVYNFRMEYIRRPVGMINDADVPIGFPPQHIEAIEWGAKLRGLSGADDLTRIQFAKATYNEMQSDILSSFGPAEPVEFGWQW